MRTTLIAGEEFEFVGEIQPRRDRSGRVIEDTPNYAPDRGLHRFARGPFCMFRVTVAPALAGVYTITENDAVRYIGETQDLAEQFGPRGFGEVFASNGYKERGTQTNCRVNALILQSVKAGDSITVWLRREPGKERRHDLKTRLALETQAPWNHQHRQ